MNAESAEAGLVVATGAVTESELAAWFAARIRPAPQCTVRLEAGSSG